MASVRETYDEYKARFLDAPAGEWVPGFNGGYINMRGPYPYDYALLGGHNVADVQRCKICYQPAIMAHRMWFHAGLSCADSPGARPFWSSVGRWQTKCPEVVV
jgi:hypothetical protein